jgi:hypothetical protein
MEHLLRLQELPNRCHQPVTNLELQKMLHATMLNQQARQVRRGKVYVSMPSKLDGKVGENSTGKFSFKLISRPDLHLFNPNVTGAWS